MKRFLPYRLIAGLALAATALGASTTAQARPDVQVSIGLPGLPGLPVPVLVPPPLPAPVLVRPAPVFEPRPVYVPPTVVYERDWQPSPRDRFEREREWRHHEWQRREWERRAWEHRRYGHDRDGDGVPNRYDRRPDDPYRR